MTYPNNDLWSVRQIEFFQDALKGYEERTAEFYPNKEFSLIVPGIATYNYKGILHFANQDRTIIFEQGEGFGLKEKDILDFTQSKNIKIIVKPEFGVETF